MPTAGEALGRMLMGLLERRGIEVQTGRTLEAVDPRGRRLLFGDGGAADYDLLLAIAPHRTAPLVRESGLANEAGFVPVDPRTLASSAPEVSGIGDVTQIPIGGGKFLPKAGVFAEAQARVVAARIADELRGREPSAAFDGRGSCFVEMGDGLAAFATGDFYAPAAPDVRLRGPARRWHRSKVLFEKWWLARWV
jgi:sulfide:quinone oxidoreductase